MSEIWKDIYFVENGVEYDYRNLYQVSNFGRVKSFHNDKEKILKAVKNTYGYEFVNLCKNSKHKAFQIHRLVAHMFIKGYFKNAQVNHIDENKENNHVENLEWCDRKYNINFGTRNEKASKSMKGKQNTKGSLVARYNLKGELIDVRYQFEYARIGFIAQNITGCCKGRLRTCQGFIFKYATDDDINNFIIQNMQIRIE